MQLSYITQSNEADRLRFSGLQSSSQPVGLTALAAANPLAPARSNRAAASVAWVFFTISLTFQQGVAAVPVRLQPKVQRAHSAVMQPTPGKAQSLKHTALLSTHQKKKAAQEANVQSEASAVPDFLQLGSDIEDNSSSVFPYMTPALLEENMTAMYDQEVANNSVPDIERGSSSDKQPVAENPSVWPWVHMGSIVRKVFNPNEGLNNKSGMVKSRRGAGGKGYLDQEERDALLKERDALLKQVNGYQHSDTLNVFSDTLLRHTFKGHRWMTSLGITAGLHVMVVAAVTAVVCLWLCLTLRYGRTAGVRAQVEALHVSKGHEIRELFHMKERYDCCHFQPLNPGKVLRLQGIVKPGRLGQLVAPLSRRDCVHFSACASTKRHDGIHAIPVAFHSMCVDFTITLLDAPEIQIAVCGHDVALFESDKKGMTQDQRRFQDSPDHWQDFILTHRADPSQTCAALRSETSLLEFREVALLTGAIVTCVGELRQGPDGMLRLFPCGEVGAEGVAGDVHPGIFGERWRTSWERPEAVSMKAPEKVLISDDKRLLRQSPKGWGCVSRHAGTARESKKMLDTGQENAC